MKYKAKVIKEKISDVKREKKNGWISMGMAIAAGMLGTSVGIFTAECREQVSTLITFTTTTLPRPLN